MACIPIILSLCRLSPISANGFKARCLELAYESAAESAIVIARQSYNTCQSFWCLVCVPKHIDPHCCGLVSFSWRPESLRFLSWYRATIYVVSFSSRPGILASLHATYRGWVAERKTCARYFSKLCFSGLKASLKSSSNAESSMM